MRGLLPIANARIQIEIILSRLGMAKPYSGLEDDLHRVRHLLSEREGEDDQVNIDPDAGDEEEEDEDEDEDEEC